MYNKEILGIRFLIHHYNLILKKKKNSQMHTLITKYKIDYRFELTQKISCTKRRIKNYTWSIHQSRSSTVRCPRTSTIWIPLSDKFSTDNFPTGSPVETLQRATATEPEASTARRKNEIKRDRALSLSLSLLLSLCEASWRAQRGNVEVVTIVLTVLRSSFLSPRNDVFPAIGFSREQCLRDRRRRVAAEETHKAKYSLHPC